MEIGVDDSVEKGVSEWRWLMLMMFRFRHRRMRKMAEPQIKVIR
jgi:hypothetical protein